MTKLALRLDRELCMCAENCLRYAPATFETGTDGKVTTKPEPWDDEKTIRIAVRSCPVGALSIDESPGA